MDVKLEETNIYEALLTLGNDNCMTLKPVKDWPAFINYDHISAELNKLHKSEFDTFIIGEHSIVIELVQKYELHELHNFLNLVFDSELNKFFYY